MTLTTQQTYNSGLVIAKTDDDIIVIAAHISQGASAPQVVNDYLGFMLGLFQDFAKSHTYYMVHDFSDLPPQRIMELARAEMIRTMTPRQFKAYNAIVVGSDHYQTIVNSHVSAATRYMNANVYSKLFPTQADAFAWLHEQPALT